MPRRHSFEDVTLDLTPLIDVVFVLLIGFVLMAPLLDQDHIALAQRPSDNQRDTAPLQESTIQIRVFADNSIWVGQRRVTGRELDQELILLRHARPDHVPVLLQDHRASFGTYQEVKHACERCGFPQLDILLEPGR